MRAFRYSLITFVGLALGCGGSGGGGGGGGSGYNFVGTWSGTLSNPEGTCSDGSKVPADSSKVAITIASAGLQIMWHAKCADIYLSPSGNTATQTRPVTCAPVTAKDGTQVTETIRDTTLVVNVNALSIDSIFDFALASGGKTGSCTVGASGTFIRQ